MVLSGVLLALTATSAGATADESGPEVPIATLLQQLGGASIALDRRDVRDAHADFVRRLGAVDDAARRCGAFLGRYGANQQVQKILRGLREKPGHGLFTTPQIVDRLERAVGRPIALSQVDLELCLQASDRRLGAKPGEPKPGRLAAIGASLHRCLSSLDAIGPDLAGIKVLQRIGRRVGDDRFTSAATLADLRAATGRAIHLTPRDLETCVDAYDLHVGFEQLTVGDNPPPCGPDEDYCAGTGGRGAICCSQGEVCQQTCGGSTCSAACVAQWCFPADATVRTAAGMVKTMREIRLGDRIEVVHPDGSFGYQEVYLNTHRDGLSVAPFVQLTLASGHQLTLSPRHFIPVASEPGEDWERHVTRGADEVRAGDLVWARGADGALALDRVTVAATTVAVGAYNPLTMNGTIVVDGVVASAHSDWFLDGIVAADTQAKVYQAILSPVRLAYRALGPQRMTTITEDWGVVDVVREAIGPGRRSASVLAVALALATVGLALLGWRRWRAIGH